MKIGYDAKRAFRNNSGLGNYSRMVIGGIWNEVLRMKHPEGKLSTLKNKNIVAKNDESADAVVLYTPSVKGRHEHYFEEVGGMRYEVGGIEIRVPKGVWRVMPDVWRSVWTGLRAKGDGVELFHGLSHELPFGLSKGVKKVVTMHDLIVRRYPEFFKPADRIIHRLKMHHACRVADVVVAISEQTKSDLMELMGVEEEKIRVVYQSCDPIFWDLPPNPSPKGEEGSVETAACCVSKHEAVREKYGLPERYVICVGTVEERKNQATAVRALALLPEDVQLVIVGRPRGNYPQEVRRVARECGVENRVVFLDKADFADFPMLYSGAVASVYMSVFEGFGIPILESFCCDTPVVTSNCSSMPEAGGEAALYAAPSDYETVACHLRRLLEDGAFRRERIEKGQTQRLRFAPQKVSADMMAVYKSLLND